MFVSENCSIFAEKLQRYYDLLRNKTINLNDMKQTDFWQKVRKVLINKYAITLYVFAVLFIFIGEQSLINQCSRAVESRKVEKAIEHEKTVATQAEGVLRSLETPDSLERFAREHYNMHADGEEVYLVD